jgi:hypothetical protein
MFAVDRLAGMPTVRPETLSWMTTANASGGRRYPAHSHDRAGTFLRLYAQGYWRVRFLEETRPGLLKELLSAKYDSDEWLRSFAKACGLGDGAGWAEVDLSVARHFEQ